MLRSARHLALLIVVLAVVVPSSAHAGLRLRQIDGGPGYYGRFSDPLPTDRRFFPIGVWFESVTSQADVHMDKAAGLNLYVVLTSDSDLSLIRRSGIRAILPSSSRSEFSGVGSETAGWELMDEIDADGPAACMGRLQSIKAGLPPDGRARYNNFSKEILVSQSAAQASCFVNSVDLVSSDLYWFTDPWQETMTTPAWLPERAGTQISGPQVRRAANYGYQIDQMRRLDAMDGRRKPIWAFVEDGWPFSEPGSRAITPAEIRAAVWHSLIAGARGIIYFNHSFGGPDKCRSQHVLRDVGCYARVRAMVKAVNAQVTRLAPVLNSPFADGLVAKAGQVRAMAKYDGRHFYVFAGNRTNAARSARFVVRCVGNATATVLGEGRTIPVRRGRFTDHFADGNAVHIYRIDGGATCGLPRVAGVSARRRTPPRGHRVVAIPSGRLLLTQRLFGRA